MNEKLRKLEDNIEKEFFDRKAVVFKIQMPYTQFKHLLRGKYSREMLENIEKHKLVGVEKIKEWHLSHVPPQYIVSHETFEKRFGEV